MRLFFTVLLVCIFSFAGSQEPMRLPVEDDMGIVEDRFQELFFEALKQKGIENYSRAIELLQQCIQMNSELPELYFEMGKNYKHLNLYLEAEQALKRALELKPDDEWILDELYDVYFQQDDTVKAMEVVKQLVEIHPDYKQDLATLYLKQRDYKSALRLLDELDSEFGPNELRNAMRQEIFESSGDDNGRIEMLRESIAKNPKNEQNYLNLIYLLSQKRDEDQAYSVAQELLEEIPDSERAHLALYKFQLSKENYEAAVASMKIVLNSDAIDPSTKKMVLDDFVSFVKVHPEFEELLIDVTSGSGEGTQSNKELGYFYLQKGNKKKALEYFNTALTDQPEDYSLIKDALLLKLEFEDYSAAVDESTRALELYPAQPLLYLIQGVALNRLSKSDQAIEGLEMGLDFVVDDVKMEIDFYKELSLAHRQINNIKQSDAFAKKVEELRQEQK